MDYLSCWCICEHMYRVPSRGPCIGSIYTHPSRVWRNTSHYSLLFSLLQMANWQGYVSISQFPAHLIWDTRTRHGYVSVPYPYRIRIRHGIHVYPGVSVFLRSSRQCKFRIVVLDFNFAFSDVSLSVTDLCKTQETFTILTIDKS